ncbi:MAG TPA: thiamine pyrophosphate-binding protein [Bacteriovoracaceae bacterium]|nr:thiamine pyrophosphate-binding protein [Bacteriovoracaceae bacterium]
MNLSLETIQNIFFCTGARNQELLTLFKSQTISFEYDERMASFKALGLTKISLAPVAICTTSGTAVAECIPAMLEAFYSKNPLLLISGDRPKKLHGTGSPQTIDHEALTRSCRGTFLEMTLREFSDFSLKDPVYPVHINVLVDDTTAHEEKSLFHQEIKGFLDFLKGKKKPVFIFSHEDKSMRPLISEFKKTGLPFYAETLSGGRDLSYLQSEKQLIDSIASYDCVVRIGFTPLSKLWRMLEKKPMPVFSFDSRSLSGLSYGEILPWTSEKILSTPEWWSALSALPINEDTAAVDNKLISLIDKYPHSEIATFKRLHDLIGNEDLVFLGNSLVIRFFELVQTRNLSIFGNRGVNGIDGQLATAIGMALGTKKTVYCILGDITTLYDLSSLREMPLNLKLIIINNQGGRIFDMLKLDKRIVMEHNIRFAEICRGFVLSYGTELSDLHRVQVLELNPTQVETNEFLREWNL